jgi:uncharacterized protein (TIGR03435 family)
MTDIITEAVLAIGASLPASIVAKATIVAAIALLAGRLSSRKSASMRHLVFTTAFAMLLVLPMAASVAPAVNVPIRSRAAPEAAGSPTRADPVSPRTEQIVPAHASTSIAGVRFRPTIPELLFASWLAGLLASLLPVGAGLWQLRNFCRSAQPWLRGGEVLRSLANRAAIRRRVDVLLHESIPGPMTFGAIRPAILFPADAETWADDDVRRAMFHELEHVRRGDWIIHCITRSVCSFYWFHPLVWMSWRRLSLDAERACDDAVLQFGEPAVYAEQLVTLAGQLATRSARPVLAMADRRDLRARVMSLLDTRQQRGKTAMRYVGGSIIAAALIAAAISPLRVVAAFQSTGANEKRPAFEVASIKPGDPQARGVAGIGFFPGRAAGTNVILSMAITAAYDISWKQLDGDSPILDEKFDIDARTAPNAIPDGTPIKERNRQLRLMLQTLLAERFKLAVHKETKDLPIYAIVVGKNGPRLKPAKETCSVENPCRQGGGPAIGIIIRDGDISRLAEYLTVFMDRFVVDRTGIQGHFDIDLPSWNPSPQVGTQVILDGHEPAPSPTDATIFTVVQEQLGLRIESARGPVDLYIVDHVERPIPD